MKVREKSPMTRGAVAVRVRNEMALAKKEFARRLRSARESADLTQAQVAQQIGVDWATYQRWEVGRTSPRPGKLDALAGVLGDETDHLRGIEEDTETALERLVAQGESTARAIRELRVALDGVTETLTGCMEVLGSIESALTEPETWAHRTREAGERIPAAAEAARDGTPSARADRAARPRSR